MCNYMNSVRVAREEKRWQQYKKFGEVEVAVSVCEELSYGSTSPSCAKTSSRPLGEKSVAIAIIVRRAFETPSRSLGQGAGYGMVEDREVWCAKPCCVVPTRRCCIVQVIAIRDIKVGICARIAVRDCIIEAR